MANSTLWALVGGSAACLTTLAFLPQIIKILRTRSAKDVSVLMLLQLAVGTSLWTAYGLHIRDPIVITANVITFLCVSAALILYRRYR